MRLRALAAAAALVAAAPALAQASPTWPTWQAPDQGGASPSQPQAPGTCYPDLQGYCPDLTPPLLFGQCRRKDFDKRPDCQASQGHLRDQQEAPQG